MKTPYKYFTIDDATYAYTIAGKGEPLVLLHGFTGSHQTWEECIKTWENDYKVISLDLPGHGRTKIQSIRTMRMFCTDLNYFLKELTIDKAHILGYSMGGRVALSFAIQYPEKVRTLMLESASPGLKTAKERMERQRQDAILAEQILKNGIVRFVNDWENIPLFETQKQLKPVIREKIRQERLSQSPQGLADALRYMGTGTQPSNWGKLQELLMPVLLIVGRFDEKFIQTNQRMQQGVRDAELRIIEQAGHCIHVEQPEKFVKMVMEFMEENYT